MLKKRNNVLSRNLCLLFVALLVSAAFILGTGLTSVQAAKKAALVDINSASQKELEGLKGIGAATAKKIIAARPYKSVDGLSKAGLSAKAIADLKPYITVGGTTAATTATKATTAATQAVTQKGSIGLVNINTATQKELEGLKGIGAATAKKIIAARPYKSVDDLSNAGLSKKQIADIKPYVTIGKATVVSTREDEDDVPDLVNINTASQKELESLKGVGAATAKKIIAARPYKSVDELSKAGLSTKQIAALRSEIIVGGEKIQKSTGTSKTSQKQKLAPGTRININKADLATLETLPNIGPVKAQAIIDGRPYNAVEDIMKVKGIKQKTFDAIKDYIVVR